MTVDSIVRWKLADEFMAHFTYKRAVEPRPEHDITFEALAHGLGKDFFYLHSQDRALMAVTFFFSARLFVVVDDDKRERTRLIHKLLEA